jgi:cell division protein FtsQ
VVLAVVLAAVLARTVLTARWLSVSRILVAGNSRVTTEEIHLLVGKGIGTSMLTVDIRQWRDRLRNSPWIADAVVRRVFPDAVAIDVSERVAMAFGRFGDRVYLIDASGTPIDVYGPRYADLDLPLVTGLPAAGSDGPEDVASRTALERVFAAFRRHQDLAARIARIDVADPSNVGIALKGDDAIVRVGDDDFAERLRTYDEVGSRLRERVGEIESADVRYDDTVIVKPVGPRASS